MIDANAAGSDPQLDGSSVVMCDNGDALTVRGLTISNSALSHAAKPRGRSMEFRAGSPHSALLRSCS
jgi:hypothetical protein